MTSIIICADDYAEDESISHGIRELVKAYRLSAVSCMTNSPLWPTESKLLKPLHNLTDIGVHFNLTHKFIDNKYIKLEELILRSIFNYKNRLIDKTWITDEFNNQLDSFESAFGCAPDFIDGHHHIHVFPVIRQIILDILTKRYKNAAKKIWLRRINPSLRHHDAPKKAMLLNMLAYEFTQAAESANFQLSGDFTGLYSLNFKAYYKSFMQQWLKTAKDNTLIMCHPSNPSNSSNKTRVMEYNFLISQEFLDICKSNNIKLIKYSDFINKK